MNKLDDGKDPVGQLEILRKATSLLTMENISEVPKAIKQAKAAAMYYAAKGANEEARKVDQWRLTLERNAGLLLRDMPKQEPGEHWKEKRSEPTTATYAEQGIDKHDASRWQQLAKIPDKAFETFMQTAQEVSTSSALSLATSITRSAREQETKKHLHKKVETVTGLHPGDFRLLSPKLIPDNSVHLVLTDPPYDGKSVQLFSDAAKEAARILRPGGSMLVYSGQKYLYEVGQALGEYLRYWWTFCIIHSGSHQLLQKLGVRCGWKPVIWMVKATRGEVSAILEDTLIGGGREKDSHEWQQAESEAASFIEMFTAKGETVVDFFAGSGTTGRAAGRLGRRWIGMEIDSEVASVATRRIHVAGREIPE